MAGGAVQSLPGEPRDRLPRLGLALMAAAVFAAVTTEVLPVGLLPVISRDLGTSESKVGLLVSAYAVIVAVGSIPLAALVVRWPRRHVLCGLLGTYALSNGVMASTTDYWVALAARLLGGLAHAGFFGAVFAAAVSMAPPAKAGRAVAFVGSGTVLALSVGVPLGTALGNAFGWRWTFAGCALLMAALAALTLVVLPADHPVAYAQRTSLLTAVRARPIVVVAAMIAVLTLGHYTPFTYISPLLQHSGVGSDGLSLVLLGYGVAGAVGLLLSTRVVDKRPRSALRDTIILITVCLLALGIVPGATSAVVFIVLWGLAFGALPTLIQAVALRAAPEAPHIAPAVVNSMFNVGIAGGAFLGSRELSVAAPPVLALIGAGLTAASLLLLSKVPGQELGPAIAERPVFLGVGGDRDHEVLRA